MPIPILPVVRDANADYVIAPFCMDDETTWKAVQLYAPKRPDIRAHASVTAGRIYVNAMSPTLTMEELSQNAVSAATLVRYKNFSFNRLVIVLPPITDDELTALVQAQKIFQSPRLVQLLAEGHVRILMQHPAGPLGAFCHTMSEDDWKTTDRIFSRGQTLNTLRMPARGAAPSVAYIMHRIIAAWQAGGDFYRDLPHAPNKRPRAQEEEPEGSAGSPPSAAKEAAPAAAFPEPSMPEPAPAAAFPEPSRSEAPPAAVDADTVVVASADVPAVPATPCTALALRPGEEAMDHELLDAPVCKRARVAFGRLKSAQVQLANARALRQEKETACSGAEEELHRTTAQLRRIAEEGDFGAAEALCRTGREVRERLGGLKEEASRARVEYANAKDLLRRVREEADQWRALYIRAGQAEAADKRCRSAHRRIQQLSASLRAVVRRAEQNISEAQENAARAKDKAARAEAAAKRADTLALRHEQELAALAVRHKDALRSAEDRAKESDRRAWVAEERAQGMERRVRDTEERAQGMERRVRDAEERAQGMERRFREVEDRAQAMERRMREAEERARTSDLRARQAEDRARMAAAATTPSMHQRSSLSPERPDGGARPFMSTAAARDPRRNPELRRSSVPHPGLMQAFRSPSSVASCAGGGIAIPCSPATEQIMRHAAAAALAAVAVAERR